MRAFRAMLAVLIGVALAVAPLGSAWAARKVVATASTTHDVGAGLIADHASHDMTVADADTAAMSDCERMGMANPATATSNGHSSSDCPCCDTDKTCPPDLCPMKIFKVFGLFAVPSSSRIIVSALLHPGEPQRPPDWIDSPQPPPPRA